MTPEEKSLLERTYKLAEQNNAILKGIRRTNRIGIAIKIFYWLVIIGATLGAFYFIQPYIESTMGLLDQAQNSIQSINGTVGQVQGALNSLR